MARIYRLLLLGTLALSACGLLAGQVAAPRPTTPQPTSTSTEKIFLPATSSPTLIPTLPIPSQTAASPISPTLPPPTPLPTLNPEQWRELPVLPDMSSRAHEIYLHGQTLGNNPLAFSKIGDCGSTPAWFLGDFDLGPRYYKLGEHTNLEPVIAAFQGSYSRTSLAAKSGFNASSVFSPLWSDRQACDANEAPLTCEYRVFKPSFAFIMLGTNDVYHQDTFEKQMRTIIEYTIAQGVVPILSTKADDLEGDGNINAVIAELAREYQIPLWNYWKAVQGLPNGGLQEDDAHITWAPNRFNDQQAMRAGWPVRNLTALQVLDIVWRYVTVKP
jgi:hypothetical protein